MPNTFAGLPVFTPDEQRPDYGRFLIHGPQGAGKGGIYGTPVLTPAGWVPIEKLEPGQAVTGRDGRPQTLLAVFDRGVLPTWRVTFNDGASTVVDGTHLWQVRNRKGHDAVLTTEQIIDGLARGGTYTIPRMSAAQHPEADLPVHPYVLGSLLADGHLSSRTIEWTKNREETVQEFRKHCGQLVPQDVPRRGGHARVQRFSGDANGQLRDALENLDLRVKSSDKFIPTEYLTASEQQRRDLLAGLFDGDGRVSGKGQPLYHSMSLRLVEDVQRLCWSLGIGANIRREPIGDGTYRLGLTTTEHNPFRTAEHAERVNIRDAYYAEARRIVSVEPEGDFEVRCIYVSNPDHLYVTEDYIVTHNSTLASTIAALGRTLYIDLIGEKGTRSFQGAPYARNIDVVRPRSVKVLDDMLWELDKPGHPYKAVVLDSLTALQNMTMRFLLGYSETTVKEIENGSATADLRTWGQSGDILKDVATFWYGLADADRERPMHVVMTAQTKVQEDETTGSIVRRPDVQPGALGIMLASPDYILYADVEDNLDAEADDEQPTRHIVRFGSDPAYRIKARLPYNVRGKIPPVLGRDRAPSLAALSRELGIGGAPPKTAKKAAPKTPAKAEGSAATVAEKSSTQKEQ